MNVPESAAPSSHSELAKRIAVKYYKSAPKIERVSGYNNAVFRLRFADDCKVLKLAKRPEKKSIRKELMMIGLLNRRGIPAPNIEHADEEGAWFGRPFFIMESAGDRTVADWIGKPGDVPRRLFAEMGSVLARIHDVTFPKSGDIRPEGIVSTDARGYLDTLYRAADWMAERRLLEPSEVSDFKALSMPETRGVALCHSDFHAVQCIVREERIAAVVDWESAWSGNAAIDFAITHAYLDYYSPPELIRSFINGYTSHRALPSDYDRAYVPVRMALALSLLRVWHSQGPRAWQYALSQSKVQRAIDLFRAYLRKMQASS